MLRNLGRIADVERNYIDDFGNNAMKKLVKEGDEAHDAKMYDVEAHRHRNAQDMVKNRGETFKYTDDGKEAFAWNSLWAHSYGTAIGFEEYDKKLDDMVYYDGKGHYYLTPEAKEFADTHEIEYANSGISSLVPPKTEMPKIKRECGREMGRMASGDFVQNGGGYKPTHLSEGSYQTPTSSGTHERRRRYETVGDSHPTQMSDGHEPMRSSHSSHGRRRRYESIGGGMSMGGGSYPISMPYGMPDFMGGSVAEPSKDVGCNANRCMGCCRQSSCMSHHLVNSCSNCSRSYSAQPSVTYSAPTTSYTMPTSSYTTTCPKVHIEPSTTSYTMPTSSYPKVHIEPSYGSSSYVAPKQSPWIHVHRDQAPVHYQTGKPYDHSKPSNQQGYATSSSDIVYYPMDYKM